MGAEREAVVVQEIVPGSFKAVLTLAGGEEVRLQEGNAVEERLVAMDVEQKEGVFYRTGRGISVGVVGWDAGFFECGDDVEVSGGIR